MPITGKQGWEYEGKNEIASGKMTGSSIKAENRKNTIG